MSENKEFPNHYKKTKLSAYIDLKNFQTFNIYLFIFQRSK